MNKAFEILDKYEIQSQGDYLKKDALAAMKEIASLAFNEGYKAAGCMGDPEIERDEYIAKLFEE